MTLSDDAALAKELSLAAGRLLLDVRADFGPVDPQVWTSPSNVRGPSIVTPTWMRCSGVTIELHALRALMRYNPESAWERLDRKKKGS